MPTNEELRILQALPLDLKVKKTQLRIREWVNYYGIENCAISFSGGKDSMVLLHIVREMFPEIEAVFCNTGLEYPEIREFAKSFDNVAVLTPKMNFRDVIIKYGYPFISKEVAERVHNARRCLAGGVSLRRTLLSAHRNISQRERRKFSGLGVSLARDMTFRTGATCLHSTSAYHTSAVTK